MGDYAPYLPAPSYGKLVLHNYLRPDYTLSFSDALKPVFLPREVYRVREYFSIGTIHHTYI